MLAFLKLFDSFQLTKQLFARLEFFFCNSGVAQKFVRSWAPPGMSQAYCSPSPGDFLIFSLAYIRKCNKK